MTAERERLLQRARQALEQERWRELLQVVRELQRLDPEAAQPFLDALWEYVHSTRGERQARVQQAQDLYQSAREGHWEQVWETLRAMEHEDPSAARHLARLLFVHPSYFTEQQPRESVRQPHFWAHWVRPREVALYHYGYGRGTLGPRHRFEALGVQWLALALAVLSLPQGWSSWPGLVLLVLWGLGGWWLARRHGQASWSPRRALGLLAVAAGLVAAAWPWGAVPLPAVLALAFLVALMAGWLQEALSGPLALWSWGGVLGVLVRGIVQPGGAVPTPLWALWVLGSVALARWLALKAREAWRQGRATPWYLHLVVLMLLALVGTAAWNWLQVLPP